MKVLSPLALSDDQPLNVRVVEEPARPEAQPLLPMHENLRCPPKGKSTVYQLPEGTRLVSVRSDGATWVAFGGDGLTVDERRGHYCAANERREFWVGAATHLACFDTGGTLYVSCFA